MSKTKKEKITSPGKKIFTKKNIIDYIVITVAIFISSVGIYFFSFANSFSFGGVSGLSLLLAQALPLDWLSPSIMNMAFNIILLVIGFIVLGRGFGVKTVYGTVLLSGLLMIYPLIPMGDILPFTKGEQPLLELLFAVALTGGASALLFNRGASSGGTDIIALIFKKKLGMEPGKALMVCDAAIVCGAFFINGVKIGLFCLLGLIMKSIIIDNIIVSINRSKYFLIITSRPEPMKAFVTHELKMGATYWSCEGAYTNEEKYAIIAIMRPSQAKQLRDRMKAIDPGAFVIIMTTSDIVGRGFKDLTE